MIFQNAVVLDFMYNNLNESEELTRGFFHRIDRACLLILLKAASIVRKSNMPEYITVHSLPLKRKLDNSL